MFRPLAWRGPALAGACFLFGWLAQQGPLFYGLQPPLQPLAGLAAAGLTLWGGQLWPAVSLAAFALGLSGPVGNPAAAAIAALGTTLEAVIASRILRRSGVAGEIASVRDALALISAAVLAPLAGAAIGSLGLVASGVIEGRRALDFGLLWWLADNSGMLLALPLALAWLGQPQAGRWPGKRGEFAGMLLLSLALLGFFHFSSDAFRQLGLSPPALTAFLVPPLLWAVLRLRPRASHAIVAILAFGLLAGLPDDATAAHLFGLQLLLFSITTGALVMLGVVGEGLRSQAALRESRQALSYAMTAGHSGTFHWSPLSGENYWSDELLSLYGLVRRGFVGNYDAWLACIVPEDRPAAMAAVDEALLSGEFNCDFRIRRGDTGEIRWMAGRARVEFDTAGQPMRMQGVNVDITERKQVEIERQASLARLAAILGSLREGVIVSDMSGHILEMNPAALLIHGMSDAAEARGHLPAFTLRYELRRLDGEVIPLADWPLSRVLRGEAFSDEEIELRSLDRPRKLLVSYSGTPVRDDRGELVACVLTIRDINARKQAELARQASEAHLAAIFEHAALGIVHLALPERRFMRVNEAFCRITGYTREELLNMTTPDITHPADRAIGKAEYDRLVAGEIPGFTMEKRYRRKDGRVIWGRTVVSQVRPEPGGHNLFAIGVVEDITQARQADAARRDAERHLQLAVEIAQLGPWEWDVGHDTLSVSERWRRKFGLRSVTPRALASEWRDRIHPDDQLRVSAYVRDYLAKPKGSYTVEYRLRQSDGSYCWLASRATAIPDASGRVKKLIGAHLDITERKEAERRIREESLHDPLTRLPNRALILEYGSHLLAAAARNHGRCALLFIDLDRFKPINDNYGHEAGDRVLREVARRLLACTRKEDLVGRLGGDEFVILLPHLDASPERATIVAGHVVEALSRPIVIDGHPLAVPPSIGISHYPEQGGDMESLLHMADLAMYQAKQRGRANYQIYSPELEGGADTAEQLKSSLRQAMAEGRFSLHYQPVLDLRNERVVAAEALLRLRRDSGERLAAGEFLPVAEASGIMNALGDWVLGTACRQQTAWQADGLDALTVSVNVSPSQFNAPEFVDHLADIVRQSGIEPGRLQLEIPESIVQDGDGSLPTFQSLKRLGVRLALDDFGSGSSNLAYLSKLPVDQIKIDQALIHRLASEPDSQAAARAIIALGQTLHLDVVGEGIESAADLDRLRDFGCDEAQGYFYCRPLAADDFSRWVRQRLH